MNAPYVPKTIVVNGQNVPIFGALDNNQLAIVDLNTIKRLANMLPKANITEIIKEHITTCNEIGNKFGRRESEEQMKEFTNVLENELRFHQTINQLTNFELPVEPIWAHEPITEMWGEENPV